MSESNEKKIWREPAFLVGIGLTVLVLGGFACTLFVWPMNDEYATKWDYIKKAQPNEIGDTLAGVAGTLAFVWIVVTVWLQATELREQRQEFSRMATAQEAQTSVLEKQKEIFEDEKCQRDETRAEAELTEMVKQLGFIIKRIAEHDPDHAIQSSYYFWLWDNSTRRSFEKMSSGREIKTGFDRIAMLSDERAINLYCRRVAMFADEVNGISFPIDVTRNDLFFKTGFRWLSEPLKDLHNIRDRLSSAQKFRLQRLGLLELEDNIARFMEKLK
ncbi:hypothetical protein [Aliiroseovarius sediminis]|uniref:hypothetical protein n=1 Tax=Aliiroseovarius sediminis TaxID=2925839 RepID=UPI001F561C00|nr:hypothetical protein [Aliiroseovarius sediminis]MCI2394309.1 hypothetical protein [Aliiroseovarius sediminis]